MKNKSVSHLVLTGLFVVLVLAASNSIVRAQGSPPTTSWIGSKGDWFNCSNWSGVCPNPLVDAFINNGGQAQILTGSVPATADSLTLGDQQGDSGGVVIDTDPAILDIGSSSCRGDFYIGNQGSGSVSITTGGRLRNRYAYIAAGPKSYGNVTVKGVGTHTQSQWNIFGDAGNGCPGAGLFIGAADSNGAGGTALVNVEYPAIITVLSYVDAPSVTVGKSGTLTGNGRLEVLGYTPLSQTAKVFGTLAPTGTLAIEGNVLLDPNTSNTSFHVTPQAADSLQVKVNDTQGGGLATLGGRVTVIITGTFTPPVSFTLLHAVAGRSGTKFGSQSIMFKAPPCVSPAISYHDNVDGSSDVNLDIFTSCQEELNP
jgi:hypothetical protein